MNIEQVKGENKGNILLYALSTCGWCRKTKELLDELGVAYSFVYVDQLIGKDKDEVVGFLKKWNPRCSFPTLVIGDKTCVVGYSEDEIKEALGV